MKYLLLSVLNIALLFTATAQIKESQGNTSPHLVIYQVEVSFTSKCCGTASNDFLHYFVDSFNKKNKVQVAAWQWGGCGKEGENLVLFSTNNLNPKITKKFLNAIKKIIPQQNEKNNSVNASMGEIFLDYNIAANTITNCRGNLISFYPSKAKNKK